MTTPTDPTPKKEDVEAVAAECHRQWSSWWEHMSSKMTIDSGRHLGLFCADRWQRQANTEYAMSRLKAMLVSRAERRPR